MKEEGDETRLTRDESGGTITALGTRPVSKQKCIYAGRESDLATVLRNKKCFYKYVNRRRAKENLHSLLDVAGNVHIKDKEKAELLNAFLALLN